MNRTLFRTALIGLVMGLCAMFVCGASLATAYLDNETLHSNQDPNTETRRSDHFRVAFGHYNRDGAGMSEQTAQGNLQMFEHLWQRNIVELGLNDMGQSAILDKRDGNFYRTNFVFLMTWNDGGGGGAYMSMDSNGYSWAMGNPGYCRYDPPSGATPHELGHAWEGQARGFNGSDSSGAWWECTANWFQLQLLNGYPNPGGILANSMYYCTHGRDYYDSWIIWEAAREDPRYGAAYVNTVWTNATADQQAHEFIIDRMARVDSSGSADNVGANRDLWGDMAKKCVTWDYERHQWFVAANSAEDGSDWGWYQRCRTPLVKLPGNTGWYRPERSHIPMEYGFNIIPLAASAGTTVSCNFQPLCDPVRQSDWRACLVVVNNNGDPRYSCLWNDGTNSMTLAGDESKVYLVVIATPEPINAWAWNAYRNDAGLQFPYAVSFTNATPKNVVYPVYTGTHSHHVNGGGLIQSGATVAATAYVGPNAQVLDGAQVSGYARIEDYAVVRNNAQVRDNAVVSGHAMVQDTAQVYGNAKVRDWARVFGNAKVYDSAKVIEHANVGDTGNVLHASAIAKGTTYLYSPSDLQGCVMVDGDTANGNGTTLADHGVHFGWQWGQNPSIFTNLVDNGYIYEQHTFERENAVFAWDEYGINQGFMMNGSRAAVDALAPTRGGLVLPLDGVSQYVELHNSANDFRETAYAVWVKWTGTASNQRIWSMGDGANKYMYLTPKDSTTGNPRFVISDGTTTQYLDYPGPMPANTWTHVAVTFGSPVFNTTTKTWSATGTLYVNGLLIASHTGMITPDALNAPLMENANYIGRGNAGNYLQGYVDDFRVYMKALTTPDVLAVYNTAAPAPITITPDTTAPTPDGATWLVAPMAQPLTFDSVTKAPVIQSDNAITMSATPGIDDSGWVEYYFRCTSGGGHDSGWVSFNKYTDVGLTPGTAYTYAVKMRDKAGNVTTESAPATGTTSISTIPAASFAYGPVGIVDGQITMTATKLTSPSGLVLYKFDRVNPTVGTSGWQTSPTYTNTGLTTGTTYYYRVTAKDGRGNIGVASTAVGTAARDVAAPKLQITVAQWNMMPYATIDNKASMTAAAASDPAGVQYYFHCTSANGVTQPDPSPFDSGWQDSTTYVTPALADGTYTFRYKVRDKSASQNVSAYSTTLLGPDYAATIKPTTGYHSYTLSQLAALPDDYLVSFTGTVMKYYENYYVVKDIASGATINVKPNAGKNDGSNNEATNPALALKNVSVKGHLYTLGGSRIVTYATVAATGDPTTYTISGKVSTAGGAAIADGVVYFSDVANPSVNPIVTATTDASGNYTRPVTPGIWYVAAGHSAYNTSADQTVTVASANIGNINFTLAANFVVSGTVTDKFSGVAIGGASVFFSKSPNASSTATFTATADSNGNYIQPVQNGTWYVCAVGTGYAVSADQTLTMSGANVANFGLQLTPVAPVAFYRFENDVNDAMGAFNGTAYNTPTYVTGQVGLNAIQLNGTNQYVSIPRPVSNNWTISFFVKTTQASPGGIQWYNGKALVDGEVGGLNNDFGVSYLNSKVAFGVGNPDITVQSTSNINTGAWVHVACTRDSLNGQMKIYINGTLETTGVGPTGTRNSPGVLSIGQLQSGGNYFSGTIDQLKIYDQVLTAGTIQLLAGENPTNYTITASAGAGGSISPAGTTTTPSSSIQTYTMIPNNGYGVANVVVDGVSMGAIAGYTFMNVQANHTISVTFQALTPYTITASAGPGGTITPGGSVTVYSTTSQKFTIAPNTGFVISQVTVDGVNQGAVSTYTFTNIQANHTIAASFAALPTYTITASAGTGGTCTPAGVTTRFQGQSQTYTIAPSANFGISQVTVDGVNQGAISTYTFTNIQVNHTISATFIQNVFTITASGTSNGSISPSGAVSVNRGGNQTFTMTPNSGYGITSVTVDGVSQGQISSYTFNNVTANHTITARFTAGNVVRSGDLLFACSADDLPASGPITTWLTTYPTDGSLTAMAGTTPVVETISGKVWEQNSYADGDGFQFGDAYSSPIPVNGASIVAVIKPVRNSTATSWVSAVDIFGDRLVLGVRGDSGRVCVKRNGSNDLATIATAIPSGQVTILTLVVQPDGTYKVWANGTQIMNITTTNALTSLVPTLSSTINVGRGSYYAWSTFNGNIGDVYVYKVALSDSERGQLESSVAGHYGIPWVSATDVASIAALRACNNGDLVKLTGSGTVIYAPRNSGGARSTAFFYIAEKQGIRGLKVVDKTADTLTLGNQVTNLTGYVRKPAGGEIYLELTADTTGSGNTPIRTLGANNKVVLCEPKVTCQAIRVWGKVQSINGTTSFTISDGYGVNITVNVNGVALPSPFDTTKTVAVTGVLSVDGIIQAQEITAGP